METAFGWIGEFFRFVIAFFPTWAQCDVNEAYIKHKGFVRRVAKVKSPGIFWYWPAFSQIEGPFKVVWQPLTTKSIDVMTSDQETVSAKGFAKWRITDLIRFAVENEGSAEMLEELIAAAIRDVIRTKTVDEIQGNDYNKTDKSLLREVSQATADLGVEVKVVRLTTFTKVKALSMIGGHVPYIEEQEDCGESQ